MTNAGNALNLINFILEDIDPSESMVSRYKSCMDALSDYEYINMLPKKYQDQKVIEEAWEICKNFTDKE